MSQYPPESKPSTEVLKHAISLHQKKFRDTNQLILVEGRHPIEEALRAGLQLKTLFLQHARPERWPSATALTRDEHGLVETIDGVDNIDSADEMNAEDVMMQSSDAFLTVLQEYAPQAGVYHVDQATLGRLSTTDSAAPCVAVFHTPKLDRVEAGYVLMLDGLQDPGNLGTLIRSAVAFGVEAVLLTGNCVEPFNPKVIRASAGLVFAVPILLENSGAQKALLASHENWTVYVTTGNPEATSYRKVSYTAPCLLILGNEGRGVSSNLFPAMPKTQLTIPMAAGVESLNVAISGSILLAEAAAMRATIESPVHA